MKIVLIGYMGSGKSSIGEKLSEVLGFPFKDLDSEIEEQVGSAVSEIFSKKGEIYFRKIENEVLKKIISEEGNLVLATGGGTPCYADSLVFMSEMENVVTIYLKTSLAILCERLFSEKAKRPLIAHLESGNELNDFIRKHLFERSYYYNQAALTIETENESIERIVEKIILKLF
ncbi:shikimate kinase [Aequorivita todarodis]|uniref:shikimate kinase n=1 Tax=Aequorivita todarodis TaxID=2036821 RepID=UPI00234FD6DA|nr:shikimate kinase [Aequorivita todarodis]MDC8002019.1 shikimate kinase [Aequorivita todarodis]